MLCNEVRKKLENYIRGGLFTSTKTELEAHLSICERCQRELQVERLLVSSWQAEESHPNTAEATAEGAPTIRLVNRIIQQAIEDTASEIVVESNGQGVQVRYRIGGLLHTVMQIPKYAWGPVVARCLSLAGLKTTDSDMEQQGHFPVQWEDKNYDLSVFCFPTPQGEKIIIKIAGKRG